MDQSSPKKINFTRREALHAIGCGWLLFQASGMVGQESTQVTSIHNGTVDDRLSVLPPGAVQLNGFLERYIQLSITKWSKGAVPYAALAGFFRKGRPRVVSDGQSQELFATGEMWGKAVRSAALFYRYTSDPELKQILKNTVADLLSTRRTNGTISCSPVAEQPDGPQGDIWERAYVLLGLDEYYSWVDQDPEVLKAMIDEADATLRQVGPAPKTRIVDLGWSRDMVGGNNIESSTILEPMMRLYKRTRFPRYLHFARYIVETEGGALHHRIFDEILDGENPMSVGGVYPKGYEMTSLFEGLVEYYRATGDARWRDAALRYFHKVIEQEITIIGNGGGDQPYHPNVHGEAWDNTAFEQTNPDIHRMMETCTGVTWLKFCHQILLLTGDPKAADYLELYAYNGLIGAMKPQGDGFSYVNLLNGVKTNPIGWGTEIEGVYVTCCNLNGPEGLAYLPLTSVMKDSEGPVINLYDAGTFQVPLHDGGSVRLRMQTRYPLEGEIRIEVTSKDANVFALKLRIPSWSEKTTLTVNDERTAAEPGTYVRVERDWSKGGFVHLSLDMRTRIIKAKRGLHDGSERFRGLMRGPMVLARDENIDPRFAEAVDLIVTDGVIAATERKPTLLETNMQFEVPTRSGTIQVVDYASVDSWKGKRVQSWLPAVTPHP